VDDGVAVPSEAMNGFFSLRHRFHTASGLHPVSCPIGTGGTVLPGVKRLGREADYLPLSSAEVKDAWSYAPTVP
jgi:hypothetical protein